MTELIYCKHRVEPRLSSVAISKLSQRDAINVPAFIIIAKNNLRDHFLCVALANTHHRLIN